MTDELKSELLMEFHADLEEAQVMIVMLQNV